MKNKYNIGGQVIQCDFLQSGMIERGKSYLANDNCVPDITISYSTLDIIKCMKLHKSLSFDQCECIYSLEKYALQAATFGKLLLHASVVVIDEGAVLFCGNGGAGKTTQSFLWKHAFGEDAEILADDRPVIGIKDGEICVWNTPWSKYQSETILNCGIKIDSICFLKHSSLNDLQPLSQIDAWQRFLNLYPKSVQCIMEVTVRHVIANIPCFLFRNNADPSSIKKAYKIIKTGMNKELQ